MFGPIFGPWTGCVVTAPPDPMTTNVGSSGLGWKADRIVSTRDMPRVSRTDYELIPGNWTAILEVYRIHRRCGLNARGARREMLVMLEPWAWAIEMAAKAQAKASRSKMSPGGAGNAVTGKPRS